MYRVTHYHREDLHFAKLTLVQKVSENLRGKKTNLRFEKVSTKVTMLNLIHSQHTKISGVSCFLPYINNDSRTCPFQVLIPFTCHHINLFVRRVDIFNASILELAAMMLVG